MKGPSSRRQQVKPLMEYLGKRAKSERLEAADRTPRPPAWQGGGLRSPSFVPLRGFGLVGYFTLMRPKHNKALTWEEITLDPASATSDAERHLFRLALDVERAQKWSGNRFDIPDLERRWSTWQSPALNDCM